MSNPSSVVAHDRTGSHAVIEGSNIIGREGFVSGGCGELCRHARASLVRTVRTIGEPRAECSKRPSSKAAASEEVRRTLRYVEPLSDARTPLVDFFSILLGVEGLWH
jgi:hypothetical protein